MKVIVLQSGGLDSTALLYHMLAEGHFVRAISFDYGQRHRRELDAARRIADLAGVEHRLVDLSALSPLLRAGCLTDPDVPVPDGHYTDARMKITVVPNRNMILLAIAIGWAVATESDAVAYAAHSGDHTIYPDCRPEFANAMSDAARLSSWRPIQLLRPFVNEHKSELVRVATRLNAPVALSWSCYKGGDIHCGTCGTCVERREAFELAQVTDPTVYAARAA